jgi:hypothetical protein
METILEETTVMQIANHLTLVKQLRNAEHFDLYENINRYFDESNDALPELAPFYDDFLRIFRTEIELYKYTLKADTARLNKTHAKRRTAYMALKRSIEASTYSDSPLIRAAAQALGSVMDDYAGLYHAPVTESSALIFNMIEDMRTKRNAPHVALLGLQDIVARLERENETFKAYYVARTCSSEAYRSKGDLRAVRRRLDLAFGKLAFVANALSLTQARLGANNATRAAINELILRVNSHIHRYEAIYSRRRPTLAAAQTNEDFI